MPNFPLRDNYAATRVPNAILGDFLIGNPDGDVTALVLRAIWLLERQRSFPRYISVDDLRSDRVLSILIESSDRFDAALNYALDFGVFIKVEIEEKRALLMLNTESAVRQADHLAHAVFGSSSVTETSQGWDVPASSDTPADAFRAYEENIGILSPMIRENILAALQDFTDKNISEAIKIAVENESRTWAFVAGVLRRWARDGIPHDARARANRRPDEQARISETELRRYLDQQRDPG